MLKAVAQLGLRGRRLAMLPTGLLAATGALAIDTTAPAVAPISSACCDTRITLSVRVVPMDER